MFGSAQWQQQTSGTKADFRGLSAVSDEVAWASGTKGTFVKTTDGGKSWEVGNVAGAEDLDFRDIDAFDASTAYILSIGNGEASRIYKTTDGGKSWSLQFKNTNKDAFFDAMAFWDKNHGIAMSDPVNGKFLIIITEDGGRNWTPIAPEKLPAAIDGEGGFAASGTCITVQGKTNAWFATGGKAARVFRSTDRGKSWTVSATPIISGVAAAGIFSIAFTDAKHGIIIGGTYDKPNEADRSVAVTSDGGKSWKLAGNAAGFRSCVAYAGSGRNAIIVVVGTSGSEYSTDNGASWIALDKENYNAVSFVNATKVGWAAGPGGRMAKFSAAKEHRKE
ncbi:MAG: glycosyl hydrolase [Acidobacteria bacterium]|nr:glycosyl hydrolase [Acidobacteriota bacterium]